MKIMLLLLLGFSIAAQARPDKAVVINGKSGPRPGTVLREKREILVPNGILTLSGGPNGTQIIATRWLQRFNLVRRLQGGSAEEIEVREHATENAQSAPGGPVPPSAIESGPLSARKLLARRLSTGWDFDLNQGKPSVPETVALLDLAFFANVLEIIPAALGTEARKPGESWKPDLVVPRGKANGIPIFKDVEVSFGSIEERPDGPHARLFISGSFTMQRPLGYNATVESTFAISLTRRLSDMLDVETTIKGTFKDSYPTRLDDGGTGNIAHNFPYTVTRTIQVEEK